MEECLKQGGEARKHSISLGSLEYSGDLSDKLMQFSKKMETVYKHLQNLLTSKSKDEKTYQHYYRIADAKLEWYVKAEVLRERGDYMTF